MATGTAWRQWVETRDTYSPQLEHGRSISQALKSFDENLLAQRTAIWSVRATRSTRTIHPGQVDDARLSQLLESRAQERPLYDMFFINRFLVQNPREPVPSDAHRLLISKDAFQLLMSCCSVPPSFLFALSRYYYPNGRGFQRRHEESNNTNNNRSSSSVSSQWYFLPFRVQVPCTDMRDSHENTRTGRNQMNPFHYLHLPNQEVDIRGSQIAVYVEYNKHTDVTTAICVNFMDGRWRVLVEEPQTRILEALMHSSAHLGPMWIHLILFTTVTRWWNNSLHSVNEQLIAYELELQDKSEDASPPNIFYGNISKALHAMAAHVHRYGTEMDSIQSTTSEMAGLCLEALNGNDGVTVANFAQLSSQITATKSFVSELEKKIQNLLALLFNRMQITNDRRMVAILEAAQDEAAYSRQIAERSQQLSEDMKKDSVSMKTIAILTMFFLPATSFAAILAMPFFATNKYLSDGRTVWIWIVLTLPTTAMAYAVYYLRNKRELEKAQEKKGRLRAV